MSSSSQFTQRTYFITLCAYQSQPHLGSLANGQVALTEAGRIAELCWQGIPEHMPDVRQDAYVIMPNHFHGILMIEDHQPPTADPRSLADVVRAFKAAATNRVNHLHNTSGAALWQPSYHGRVIKSGSALKAFRQYIADNPSAWLSDPLNPDGQRPAPFCPAPLKDG